MIAVEIFMVGGMLTLLLCTPATRGPTFLFLAGGAALLGALILWAANSP